MAISTSLQEAFVSTKPVHGLTHNFYRYPARFSPEFARQIILAFTKPSDWVLDPFVGGGTTIVESLALGRRAIGIDINSLACFSSLVKTTPLSSNDLESVLLWAEKVLSLNPAVTPQDVPTCPSSFVNIPPDVAVFLVEASCLADGLRFPRRRRFARCAILRTGQLTLDCQSSMPNVVEVKETFQRTIRDMVAGLDEFVAVVQFNNIPKRKITSMRRLFLGSAASSVVDKVLLPAPDKPTLVLTSPPYPQIHVLYNKWQILGRRETTAHYWLAALNDGYAPSFYTMGSRSQTGLDRYFQTLFQAFVNVRRIIASRAVLVQLVAFPDGESLRARYLSTMDQAGFESVDFGTLGVSASPTRTVPNRRWYAYRHEKQCSSREILMIHRARP